MDSTKQTDDNSLTSDFELTNNTNDQKKTFPTAVNSTITECHNNEMMQSVDTSSSNDDLSCTANNRPNGNNGCLSDQNMYKPKSVESRKKIIAPHPRNSSVKRNRKTLTDTEISKKHCK